MDVMFVVIFVAKVILLRNLYLLRKLSIIRSKNNETDSLTGNIVPKERNFFKKNVESVRRFLHRVFILEGSSSVLSRVIAIVFWRDSS